MQSRIKQNVPLAKLYRTPTSYRVESAARRSTITHKSPVALASAFPDESMRLQLPRFQHDRYRVSQSSFQGGSKQLPRPPLCTWQDEICPFHAKRRHICSAIAEYPNNSCIPFPPPACRRWLESGSKCCNSQYRIHCRAAKTQDFMNQNGTNDYCRQAAWVQQSNYVIPFGYRDTQRVCYYAIPFPVLHRL
jgi:hypothetical protein